MSVGVRTASITAQNTGTDWFDVDNNRFNISVSGTFVGTVNLQRRFSSSDTAKDITDGEFTSPVEKIGEDIESGVQYRLFVKTGNYTSGTIELRLSR